MTQVEREDIEEKMVAEEMRTGYLYRDKVLRPSLVSVSVKSQNKCDKIKKNSQTEAAEVPENIEININENIKEDQ
jgi:hypothetical protein